MSLRFFPIIMCWVVMSLPGMGQHPLSKSPIQDIVIQVDTTRISWKEDARFQNGRSYLPLPYAKEPLQTEVRVYPRYPWRIARIELLPSRSYRLTDSMRFYFQQYYRGEIEFTKLSQEQFPALECRITQKNGDETNVLVPVYPYTKPMATVSPTTKVFYIGEEVRLPIASNLPANIRAVPTWTKDQGIAYRIVKEEGEWYLHVLPLVYGKRVLRIPYQTFRPGMDEAGNPQFRHLIQPFEVEIKRGNIPYLDLGRAEVQLGLNERMVQLPVSFAAQISFDLKRTYRIEAQEAAGGQIVADLIPQKIESGGKMTALLRVYNFHRRRESKLFIKSPTETLFQTNFDIIPKPAIQQVQIKRAGGDWDTSLVVYPGERLSVRIKGESLHRTKLAWEGMEVVVPPDSLVMRPKRVEFDIQIPIDLARKRIPLLAGERETRYQLRLTDYQRPKSFSFVKLETTDDTLALTQIKRQTYFATDLSKTRLLFETDSIDTPTQLMGLQYLQVQATLKDPQNRILQTRSLDKLVICPADSSPRGRLYDRSQCRKHPITIRTWLKQDWEHLPPWSSLHLSVSHVPGKYEEAGQVASWEIVYEKRTKVELTMAFPIGLAFKRFDGSETQTFDGVHTAVMAEMGWYKKGKINTLHPIRVGIGFTATETFPFDGERQTDLGFGALVSLYPTFKDQRISLPLYVGGGYGISQSRWFFLVGPGLSIRLS